MIGIVRFVIPGILAWFVRALLPELHSGFRFVNQSDLPGVCISLLALSLLLPAALGTMVTTRSGGVALAAVGRLAYRERCWRQPFS